MEMLNATSLYSTSTILLQNTGCLSVAHGLGMGQSKRQKKEEEGIWANISSECRIIHNTLHEGN
jgi:hypothetical protein